MTAILFMDAFLALYSAARPIPGARVLTDTPLGVLTKAICLVGDR